MPNPDFLYINALHTGESAPVVDFRAMAAAQLEYSYLGGKTPGTEMEKVVKKFSKDYKSHRRVGIND